MVSAAAPVFGIQHPIHPPCGHLSDAAIVPSTRSAVSTVPEAFALRMGGSSEDKPTVRQKQIEVSLDLQSPLQEYGNSQTYLQPAHSSGYGGTDSTNGYLLGEDRDATGSSQGQSGSRASEESIRLSRQRCLSYDASMTRSASMVRSQQGSTQSRKSNLFRHSMSNIPSASLPFPATRQQKQAAITALKKPLQVVTKEKSLIRYTNEGRRYWRWKDVVARVLHICRGASADDYSLLLQTEHWLEACDNKHRYGSNLKPYFRAWLESDTHQSFFKWLDEGDGIHVDIPERPRKKLDLERVVYCGIERCFFEVSIDKGLFRYQLSKHLVTTDSARNAPPCPPDLGKTMDSIRQSTLRSAHTLSPRSSVLHAAVQAQGADAAASSSVPASAVTGVGHAVFSVPLGAEGSDCGQGAQDRNGASRCSLSDELQHVSGRESSPAERASTALLDAHILTSDHKEPQGVGAACMDAATGESRQNLQSMPATPDHASARPSASSVEGSSLVSLRTSAAEATVLGFSSSPATPPLDYRDVSRRNEDEGGAQPPVTSRMASLKPSQRPPGLLTKELRKVAGNPHAQLGEEVAAQVAGMKGSADSPPQATSPSAQASGAAAAVFPSRTTSARASQASRQGGNVQAQAPAGTLPAAAASNAGPGGDAAAQPQAAHAPNGPTCASPNDMEEYLHWAFGRTPSQILQQPIIGQPIVSQPRAGGARGPVYTEDQHAGGWLDSEGMLHMRRHGVNSLPSGLTRFPSLTLLTSQRFSRMDGQSCGQSDEDSESLPYGDSAGGSSSGTSPVHTANFGRHSVHALPAPVSAQSMYSTGAAAAAASPSFAPLPRGFPSMPRLGTDQEGANQPQRFPPILWTMRFPTSSTPDGTMPSYSGGSLSCQGGPVGSGILRHSLNLGDGASNTLRPTLSSQDSGTYRDVAGIPIHRRMSDSDGNVFTDAHHLSLLSAGMHMATIGPHMRTPSVGTSKELQARRLRSSLDSRVDVSHPRLVSNSAIPVNLKLLDIVETVAAPGGGSSVASAHQAGSYSNEAGEHIRPDGGSGSIVEPETRDLADMLEERMERTGQLVKVRTQAQLEDLLPCAPKVLSHNKSDHASDNDMHSCRTCASSALAPSTDISTYLGARSSRFYSSHLSLPTPPSSSIVVAAAALSGASSQGPAAAESRPSIKSASSVSLPRGGSGAAPPRVASGGISGSVLGASASKENLPAASSASQMPGSADNSGTVSGVTAMPPMFTPASEALPPLAATFSRVSAAASTSSATTIAATVSAAAPHPVSAAAGSKDRVPAAPVKDPVTEKPPEKREKWIYVWDMHSRLYINRKMPGRFHHSSFVAGGAVKAAGSIVVEDGHLKQITTWSGHYRPRESDISAFLEWLKSKGVNMETVELLVVKPHKPHKAPKGGNPPLIPNPQLPPQHPHPPHPAPQ